MTDGRAHYDGCWREHHDCAIENVRRLTAQLERAKDTIAALRQELRDTVREARDVAAEARWQERQGDEYGSY